MNLKPVSEADADAAIAISAYMGAKALSSSRKAAAVPRRSFEQLCYQKLRDMERRRDAMTVKVLRHSTNWDTETLKRVLTRMVDMGLIVWTDGENQIRFAR